MEEFWGVWSIFCWICYIIKEGFKGQTVNNAQKEWKLNEKWEKFKKNEKIWIKKCVLGRWPCIRKIPNITIPPITTELLLNKLSSLFPDIFLHPNNHNNTSHDNTSKEGPYLHDYPHTLIISIPLLPPQ